MEKDTNKVPKTYSLSPAAIKWITQKAAKLTLEGKRISESKLVDRILLERMSEDTSGKKVTKSL